MADAPPVELVFDGGCPDCGKREVKLPSPLPDVGDDIDMRTRDYDGFRLLMLEELAARFPERRRWNPADIEVAIVEALAAVLDQLSDMLDRVGAEAYLESARRPESVRRLLGFIGYDAVARARMESDLSGLPGALTAEQKLDQSWEADPALMERARRDGPRAIHTQQRVVTLEDCATRLEEHPLVLRATAYSEWGGSWPITQAAVVLRDNRDLDAAGWIGTLPPGDKLFASMKRYHSAAGLPKRDWASPALTARVLLNDLIDAYRMVGQEVTLQDAEFVGIVIMLSVGVSPDYFQSEIRREALVALGQGPSGFFAPGRLRFGEDLHASDIIQTLTALSGVENVCLNRFKRIGDQYADQSQSGRIELNGLEIAVCDNNPAALDRGYLVIKCHGGQRG